MARGWSKSKLRILLFVDFVVDGVAIRRQLRFIQRRKFLANKSRQQEVRYVGFTVDGLPRMIDAFQSSAPMVSSEVHISRTKSPQSYISTVELKLNNLGVVELVALEGAIVVAVDLANILCCSSFAVIDNTLTSTVKVWYPKIICIELHLYSVSNQLTPSYVISITTTAHHPPSSVTIYRLSPVACRSRAETLRPPTHGLGSGSPSRYIRCSHMCSYNIDIEKFIKNLCLLFITLEMR